nr:hypothetical protein BJQ95_03580 [Cryobacterium sp. SO1]
MRKLRTIHTMDVRGHFALRHGSQICCEFGCRKHAEASGALS